MNAQNDKPRTPWGRAGVSTSNINSGPPQYTILDDYRQAGFSLVPIPPVNGKPAKGPVRQGWNRPHAADNPHGYTDNPDQWAECLARGWNIGLAHGPSGTMALDVDSLEETLRVFSEAGIPLADWLSDPASVHFLSGKPGKEKLISRLPVGVSLPSVKLSWKVDGKETSIFELRNSSSTGATVQDVAPPSIHPDTGQPYKLVGDVTQLPTIPAELLDIWQHWGDWKAFFVTFAPGWQPPKESPKRPSAGKPKLEGERDSIAEFNQSHALEDVLAANGYTRKGKRFIRPGSDSGLPGVNLLDEGCCYSFGADALNDGRKHDAFDTYRILQCGGDWAAAMSWNPELTKHNQRLFRQAEGRIEQAEKPPTGEAKPALVPGKPKAQADRANVVNLKEETALRSAFERKIEETEDKTKLVYGVGLDVLKSALRKTSKEALFKLIAKKAAVSLEILKADLLDAGGEPQGRGRGNAGFLPYENKGNQLWVMDDQGPRPLCNFTANIAEEIIHDDGLNEEVLFCIEGRLHDGTDFPRVEVSASKFAGLSWVTSEWGARPLIHAGNSIKDHLRTAIQGLLPCEKRRKVYGHTGWRKVGDEWLFLHGGGGIGVDGHKADIEVKVGEGNMRHYRFDEGGGGDLCADVRASLRILDISASNPALGMVVLACVYRSPLGEAAPIDHGIFFAGQTGSRNSEVAGLALAHFGRGFNARNFPANWDDTESDLEAKGHAAKDCIFVVDDFKPRGATNDVHKLHTKADRLFRSVGNQSGRGRRTSDMKQRAAYHPRGMVLATGEDVPRGASLRARLALVELSMADVDNGILSELQQFARDGALERAMGGFLRWLAPTMDEWKKALPDLRRSLRDGANQESFAKAHPRAADIYASLLVGLDLFFMYAESVGAVTAEEHVAQFERCQTVLKEMIAAQGDLQADQDEVTQFLGYLKSSLNAGYCHCSDTFKQGPPTEHPRFWGWPIIPGQGEDAPTIGKPNGELIGWVDEQRVYWDGNAVFAAVQEMAKATGENLSITQRSLWVRMNERGLLLEVKKEDSKVRLNPQRRIAGVKRRVYIMSRKTIEDR
ncbi:MAG: bifunctional DNA primase/polymerase [Proteobacteria bacterium]|nr:bifunctional DNA primase/polymerase [Pseudomonadota bacterium]